MFDAVRTRWEVREYLKKPVPLEHILRILEAGRLAPSSKNSQPWHFIVVTDRRMLEELSRTTPTGGFIAHAAFAIALFVDKNARQPEVDAARAMQQMMLVAWELGVGSCWVSNFDQEKVRGLLKTPKSLRLITIVPFGYPARKPRGKKLRKPLWEVAHWGLYGEKHPAFYGSPYK